VSKDREPGSSEQATQRELVEQGRSLPGVAAVLDVYERLRKYTEAVKTLPPPTRNATGGNIE